MSCLILVSVLILAWFAYSVHKQRDLEQVCTEVLAVCVGAVFAFTVYLTLPLTADTLLGAVKIVFQVLQGDSGDLLGLLQPPSGAAPPAEPQPWLLPAAQCLGIVTPVMTAGTVFVFLFRRLPRPVILPWTCHVFSALDEHAILLARSIGQKETARFIFLRTRKEDIGADTLQQLQGLRYQVYPYTEADLVRRHWSLRVRPLRFYFLTENSEDNFDQMDQFLAKAKKCRFFPKIGSGIRRELFLLSETTSSPMLIDHLRKQYKHLHNTELQLLDRYRAMSYRLLEKAPIHGSRQGNRVRVLMLGMGRVGQSIFRTALGMGTILDCETSFHLYDARIGQVCKAMLQQYPALAEGISVFPYRINAESTELLNLLKENEKPENGGRFHYIVVALGDDERNLRVASVLDRYYRRQYWEGNPAPLPRLCVNLEDAVKSSTTAELYAKREDWELEFTVFGTDEETFSSEVLLPRGTWLAARKLHKLLTGRLPGPGWNEYERRSSFAAVAHAAVHVASVCPGGGEHRLREYPRRSSSKYAQLIETEHLRWMNYVRSEGMTLAQEHIWKHYCNKVHSHVDVRGKLTPCLIPSGALDDQYEKINREMGRQGGLSFRQRDELVVRNADRLQQICKENNSKIPLRKLPQPAGRRP